MRWLLTIPVVVAVVLGVWITGGVITNEFKVAMALTLGWMALLGVTCLIVAVRRRRLALPVLGAYLVAGVAIGAYLGVTTLADKVVDERVATAQARPAVHRHPEQPRNLLLARGSFQSGEHESHGTATEIRLAGGARVL